MAVCICDHYGNTAEENSMDLLLFKTEGFNTQTTREEFNSCYFTCENGQVCMHVFNIPYLFTKNNLYWI